MSLILVRLAILVFAHRHLADCRGIPTSLQGNLRSDYDYVDERPGRPPPIIPDRMQKYLGKFVYVAPDVEDDNDRAGPDFIKHEPVKGTILMPRMKFVIDDSNDIIEDCEDYDDYAGVVDQFSGRRQLFKVSPGPYAKRKSNLMPFQPGCFESLPPIPMIPDGLDPTLEEMVPYKPDVAFPRDTFIVLSDDPVVVVEDVDTTCNKKPGGGNETGEGGGAEGRNTPSEAEGGETTPAGEGGETTAGGEETTAAGGGEEATTPGAEGGGEGGGGGETTAAGGEETTAAGGEETTTAAA